MDEKIKQRIEEIRKRLEEYQRHKNDPYAYYPEEIKAVREIRDHAAEDIEFLLNEVKRLGVLRTLRHSPAIVAEKPEK
jgi:hypothetical protein